MMEGRRARVVAVHLRLGAGTTGMRSDPVVCSTSFVPRGQCQILPRSILHFLQLYVGQNEAIMRSLYEYDQKDATAGSLHELESNEVVVMGRLHDVEQKDVMRRSLLVENAPDEDQYLSGWRLGLIISLLFLGQLLMALDVNIVNVAVPEISTQFKALDDVAWYGSAYLLTITAFQPSFGSMYRFFNIGMTYKVCIIIFEGTG
jgi:hypothetical protein